MNAKHIFVVPCGYTIQTHQILVPMGVKTKSSSQQFNWANHTTQSTNYSYTTPTLCYINHTLTLHYIIHTPKIHVGTMQKYPPTLIQCVNIG